MTGVEIAAVRTRLSLSQAQLAQLLGVHALTVSKWERGLLTPTPHQKALLESFKQAEAAKSDVGEEAKNLLVTAGVVLALFVLLRAALED